MGIPGVQVGFNEFEGRGGDDIIVGDINLSGQERTRVSYLSATDGVTVDLATGTGNGTAAGDAAHVGTDHFTFVNAITGSAYADILRGSDNPFGTYELFDARGGNDLIDGPWRIRFCRLQLRRCYDIGHFRQPRRWHRYR